MDKVRSLTHETQAQLHDDNGGCPDCLTRPNFFYGQPLKHDDLTAIVDYTRARLALQRYRDGWGVASGLHVDIDPQNPLGVIVNPGYAVDCNGNDIVVCDPLPFDLTSALPRPKDCRQPTPAAMEQEMQSLSEEGIRRIESETQKRPSTTGQAIYIFDLYLKHAEKKSSPQTPLVPCRDNPGCEYSRVVEQGVLHAVPVKAPYVFEDPSVRWLEDLTSIVRAVSALAQAAELLRGPVVSSLDILNFIQKSRDWLNKYPLHQTDSGRVLDMASALLDTPLMSDFLASRNITDLIHYILDDLVNHYIRCGCGACEDKNGIRLARIGLAYVSSLQSSVRYLVYYINNQPPARRDLAPSDCYPAPPGKINLAHIIGKSPVEAKLWLARQGVRSIKVPFQRLTLEELKSLATLETQSLERLLFVDPTRRDVHILYVQGGDGFAVPERVVLFGAGAIPKPDGEVLTPRREEVIAGIAAVEAAALAQARAAAAAATSAADDLTVIIGIGPAFRDRLIGNGIDSFKKLSEASVATLRAIVPETRYPDEELKSWIDQARDRLDNPPPEEPKP